MFHKGHYEVLAARFRESLEPLFELETEFRELGLDEGDSRAKMFRSGLDKARFQSWTLVNFAIILAKRLKEDNEKFDPIRFLDRCSPDSEKYPLSELWED